MRKLSLFLTLSIIAIQGFSFCGFYVAKTDANLFNTSSQVILARDGNKTRVTMYSDYQGDTKDFAMVVPVPVVLKRSDIKTVNAQIFNTLNDYSAPRMASYYDQNPCQIYEIQDKVLLMDESSEDNESVRLSSVKKEKKYNVKIEAKYEVGEYNILILSAKQSDGLQRWLIDNGYKIPEKAADVLEPYIKSNMKFFVVKVNTEKYARKTKTELDPLQITYSSPKYMLPIRLGMANAKGEQDMLVYLFSKTGRIETSNYRNVKIPTDMEVPLFVKDRFNKFYKDVYDKSHKREDRNVVFTEYAWNLSLNNYVKCDPCVGPVPSEQDLANAGVFWLQQNRYDPVYLTRLHVRYSRETFPQDLKFFETNDHQNFQGRYVIHYPASGEIKCQEGINYLHKLVSRREKELQNMEYYAGWEGDNYKYYTEEYKEILADLEGNNDKKNEVIPAVDTTQKPNFPWGLLMITIGTLTLVITLASIAKNSRYEIRS